MPTLWIASLCFQASSPNTTRDVEPKVMVGPSLGNGRNMREEGPIKGYVHSFNSGVDGYEVFVFLLGHISIKLFY